MHREYSQKGAAAPRQTRAKDDDREFLQSTLRAVGQVVLQDDAAAAESSRALRFRRRVLERETAISLAARQG